MPKDIEERSVSLYPKDWEWLDKEVKWYGTNVSYVIRRLICKEQEEQKSWPKGCRGEEDGDDNDNDDKR